MYEEDLALNNLQWLIYHKIQPNQIIYLVYMYKEDLALNNLQWLICHKTKPIFHPAMGWIVPFLTFYKDGFSIK